MRVVFVAISGSIAAVGLGTFLYGAVRAFVVPLQPKPGEEGTTLLRGEGQLYRKTWGKPTGVGLSFARMKEILAAGEHRTDPTYKTFFLMIGGMFLTVIGSFLTVAAFMPLAQGVYLVATLLLVLGMIGWQFTRS